VRNNEGALHLKFDFAMAHVSPGSALLHPGQKEEAIRLYAEALRIEPVLAEASDDLARKRAGRPDPGRTGN